MVKLEDPIPSEIMSENTDETLPDSTKDEELTPNHSEEAPLQQDAATTTSQPAELTQDKLGTHIMQSKNHKCKVYDAGRIFVISGQNSCLMADRDHQPLKINYRLFTYTRYKFRLRMMKHADAKKGDPYRTAPSVAGFCPCNMDSFGDQVGKSPALFFSNAMDDAFGYQMRRGDGRIVSKATDVK